MSEEEDKNAGASGDGQGAPGEGASANENANKEEGAGPGDAAGHGDAASVNENANKEEGAGQGDAAGQGEGANENANKEDGANAGDAASQDAIPAKRALVMMFKLSFVVKGVENKLTEMGYSIIEQVSNLRNVGNWQNIELFVLYLSEGIVEDPRKLETVSHVCQFVHANKKPMIVIGEWNRHDALSQTVPAIDWFRWVDRPIDIEKFSGIVTQVVAAAANGDRKKRILIVDDDPYYAKLVRDWVRETYRADVVLAGTQAFDYLLKNVGDDDKVDLVLLDYEMPGVDGPQVLQMLRQDPRTANIPVVFLTGVGTKEAVMRVKGLRPDGYILKSTSKEALLDCLKDKLKD